MPATVAPTSPTSFDRPRSRARALRDLVVFSMSVTAFAAVAAGVATLATEARWSLAFVVLRWLLVAVLLATPLIHQIASRVGRGFHMPWALRTPATALLLTCESICFDIASAQLH